MDGHDDCGGEKNENGGTAHHPPNRHFISQGAGDEVTKEETKAETKSSLGKADDRGDVQIFGEFVDFEKTHGFTMYFCPMESTSNLAGRILGVDVGEARYGVAVSDPLGMLAHAVETIHVASTNPVERISQLVQEFEARAVVVGMPRNMDGSYGSAALKVRELIDVLRERLPCPVIAWDERMSTLEAGRYLRDAGRSARKQKGVIDQAAAQVILQSYLDSLGAGR